MRVLNLSDSPPPSSVVDLEPENLILLPSRCDGEGWLPEGSVATFSRHRHVPTSLLLGPDLGCGLMVARSEQPIDDLESYAYQLYYHVRTRPNRIYSYDGFIGTYTVASSADASVHPGETLALIHAGGSPAARQTFHDATYGNALLEAADACAKEGLRTRWNLLEAVSEFAKQDFKVIGDWPHNTLAHESGSYIYRRGACALKSGELSIAVGRLGDPSLLVRAGPRIEELCNSMAYSPGRIVAGHELSKTFLPDFDLEDKVMIPHFIYEEEFGTDHPATFRAWSDVASALAPYVSTVAVLEPKSYVN